ALSGRPRPSGVVPGLVRARPATPRRAAPVLAPAAPRPWHEQRAAHSVQAIALLGRQDGRHILFEPIHFAEQLIAGRSLQRRDALLPRFDHRSDAVDLRAGQLHAATHTPLAVINEPVDR